MEKTREAQKEKAFGENLSVCRKFVLGLSLSDASEMTGKAPSELSDFERNGGAVSLSEAKRLADAYGVSVPRLCSYDVFSDAEEIVSVQAAFLKKLGGGVSESERDGALRRMEKFPAVTEQVVFSLAVKTRLIAIRRVCEKAPLPKVPSDFRIVTDFAYNLRYLTDLTDLSEEKMSAMAGIDGESAERLLHGAEPSMSEVIRLAEFFGVGVKEILSPGPEFPDPAGIIKSTEGRAALSGLADPVPGEVLERDEKRRARELDKESAEELLRKLLSADWKTQRSEIT